MRVFFLVRFNDGTHARPRRPRMGDRVICVNAFSASARSPPTPSAAFEQAPPTDSTNVWEIGTLDGYMHVHTDEQYTSTESIEWTFFVHNRT